MPGYCEACPGKRNASLLMVITGSFRIQPRAGTAAADGKLLFDFLVHARTRQSSAATRIAFLMAFGFDRPWPITVMPRTPSSGAPPVSE